MSSPVSFGGTGEETERSGGREKLVHPSSGTSRPDGDCVMSGGRSKASSASYFVPADYWLINPVSAHDQTRDMSYPMTDRKSSIPHDGFPSALPYEGVQNLTYQPLCRVTRMGAHFASSGSIRLVLRLLALCGRVCGMYSVPTLIAARRAVRYASKAFAASASSCARVAMKSLYGIVSPPLGIRDDASIWSMLAGGIICT
jgi:hypothetical protein